MKFHLERHDRPRNQAGIHAVDCYGAASCALFQAASMSFCTFRGIFLAVVSPGKVVRIDSGPKVMVCTLLLSVMSVYRPNSESDSNRCTVTLSLAFLWSSVATPTEKRCFFGWSATRMTT